MNRIIVLLLLSFSVHSVCAFQQAFVQESKIREHVMFLASDELEGRGTNSKGYARAAEYAAEAFEASGLKPLINEDGKNTFYQTFMLADGFVQRIQSRQDYSSPYSLNVVGIVEGTDEALKDEYIVLSAHLDHVGNINGEIHNGANDNATGSAAILELARVIAGQPLKRSVVFALFGAEEIGLVGSRYFVDNPPVPLANMVANLNIDGVGAYINQPGEQVKLMALGADATCAELLTRLAQVNASTEKLDLQTSDPANYLRRSDQFNFHQRGIPVIMFTDYGNGHYHKPTDDAHRLQYGKLTRFVNMIHYLTINLAVGASLCR